MSATSEYIEKYKDEAMRQMKLYGIPASVTLAQGILESANGKSQLARECNNHFGIKAGKAWLQNGGQYRLYSDDKPNEKFCLYASVADSFEHHSKILAGSDRYKPCFKLAPDDYVGWTNGLQAGGYATSKKYAASLQSLIKSQHLDQFDKQVIEEMKREGKAIGSANASVSSKAEAEKSANASGGNGDTGFCLVDGKYSLPLDKSGNKDFLLITSPYGKRNDPINRGKAQFHQGIDIHARSNNLLATENNGKVIKASNATNTGGGKTVIVEYTRSDGTKTQCLYMHMSRIDVQEGDIVNAGDKLGVSGNTGTRTTGEHLHFGVRNVSKEGKQEYVNPAAYLAEICARGNIQTQAMHNGKDLLAAYTPSSGMKAPMQEGRTGEEQMSPDDWMKKLLSSEDANMGIGGSDGGLMEMAFMLFTSLLTIASQMKDDKEEQLQTITDAMLTKTIDLSSMVKGLQSCSLHLMENGKMILQTDNGTGKVNHELTTEETNRLSSILHGSMDDATKQQQISSLVNGIVLSSQASQNYEQIMQEQNARQQGMQR